MKAIKDKVVITDAYYFILSYLNMTGFKPVIERNICKYDEFGFPVFKMAMLDYNTFKELMKEASDWMLNKSLDITLETINKFNLN